MAVIELARVDGSMSTFLMVHNSLTMLTIGLLGSEAQKAELLPPMARLDWVGAQAVHGAMCCSGLTVTLPSYLSSMLCSLRQLSKAELSGHLVHVQLAFLRCRCALPPSLQVLGA